MNLTLLTLIILDAFLVGMCAGGYYVRRNVLRSFSQATEAIDDIIKDLRDLTKETAPKDTFENLESENPFTVKDLS